MSILCVFSSFRNWASFNFAPSTWPKIKNKKPPVSMSNNPQNIAFKNIFSITLLFSFL